MAGSNIAPVSGDIPSEGSSGKRGCDAVRYRLRLISLTGTYISSLYLNLPLGSDRITLTITKEKKCATLHDRLDSYPYKKDE